MTTNVLVAAWTMSVVAILVAAYRDARETDRREALAEDAMWKRSLSDYKKRIPKTRTASAPGEELADRSHTNGDRIWPR